MAKLPKTIIEEPKPAPILTRRSRAKLLRIEGVTDAANVVNEFLETRPNVSVTSVTALNHYYLLITYEETV